MKITEADRDAVRTERDRGRPKMSEEAKRKLREQKEYSIADEQQQAKRMDEFAKLTKNIPNMMNTISQFWGEGLPHLERMARKLLACLDAGLWPTRTCDITFFATLTRAEERMSEKRFAEELRLHANMKHKSSRAQSGTRYSLEYKQAQMRERGMSSSTNEAGLPC